jgi:hypothetical protein
MKSLLLRNLLLTIPTVLLFTVLGYGVSLPLSYYVDGYATGWRFGSRPDQGGIETQRLQDIARFQVGVALGGAALGAFVAQSTFLMYEVKGHSSSDRDRSS